MPCDEQDLEVKKTASFVNNNYNKEEFKYGSFVWLSVGDEDEELPLKEMAITGVQLRADPAADLYYLVIVAENYVDVEVGRYVAQVDIYVEVLSKIKLYVSEEDTVGVTAADICLQEEWVLNRWASFGIMFPMTAENYAKYNGESVYKVVVEEGAVFPGTNFNLYLADTHIYINSNYGNEVNKNGAFNWSEVPTQLYNFGECTLTNMHNRADEGNRWLFLFVEQTFDSTVDASILVKQLNTLDYIEFYTTENVTEEPITLREIYMGITTLKQFGENTAMSYTINKEYDANKMYMLHVKPGCQIPYVEDGEYGYRVVENGKSFINGVYGLTGDIFGMFDENGKPRTYETWGVWWTAVSMVSFNVEGYEVNYPKRLIAAGDVVDLRDYKIEGYDVTLTTADGEKCIGGYIVPDKDVELFLKYTVSEEEENPNTQANKKNGCSSFVGASMAFLPICFLAVTSTFVIMANKKRRMRR